MMAGFTRPQARFPPATTKVNSGSGDPKVSKGRSESPVVAPAGAKPLLAQKSSFGCKTSYMVAPIWRDNMQVVGRAAWGRVCGRAKLLAGTLRCLHLCWRLPWNWSPAQQLGRCPKPHKGRRPLTLQGTLSLDPFFGARLGRASLLLLFRRFFCLFLRLFLLIQCFFPIKHLPHLPLRFLHHPVALLNRVLLRVVINLRPE